VSSSRSRYQQSPLRQRASRHPLTIQGQPFAPTPQKKHAGCGRGVLLVVIGLLAVALLVVWIGIKSIVGRVVGIAESAGSLLPRIAVMATTEPVVVSGQTSTPAPVELLPTEAQATATLTLVVSLPTKARETPTPYRRSRSDPTPVPPRGPELRALEHQMLTLINSDRTENGLSAVQWDDLAAQVARGHAQSMADGDFLSHWDRRGYGPDQRYALAGGTEAVMENAYWFWRRYDDGSSAPIDDWQAVIGEAQQHLMQSPGHRDNVLHPDHTHVGVGIIYSRETGSLMLVQEFINRYLEIEQTPGEASDLTEVTLTGRVLVDPGGYLLINLFYEPFPELLTVDDLVHVKPHTYTSAAEFVLAQRTERDGDRFSTTISLDDPGVPGIYHVRIAFHLGEDSYIGASDWQLWLRE